MNQYAKEESDKRYAIAGNIGGTFVSTQDGGRRLCGKPPRHHRQRKHHRRHRHRPY